MEMSQETPCIANLNKQKCHIFSFFYKIGKQEGRTCPVGAGNSVGKRWGKGVGG
jgi:hypothetical protein